MLSSVKLAQANSEILLGAPQELARTVETFVLGEFCPCLA
jgi:hypothetical protein